MLRTLTSARRYAIMLSTLTPGRRYGDNVKHVDMWKEIRG